MSTATDPVAWARGILSRAGLNDALDEQAAEMGKYLPLLDDLAAAQRKVRDADDHRKGTQEKLATRLSMATWEIEDRFDTTGKTAVLIDGDKRTPMTAVKRTKWEKDETQRLAAAEVTADNQAARDLAEARDALELVEQRIAMSKRFIEAATARVTAAVAKVGLIATAISTATNNGETA